MPTITHSSVELSFSCKNLQNRDLVSKSDPQIVVFEYNPLSDPINNATYRSSSPLPSGTFWKSDYTSDKKLWREIGRTEIIKDQLSPKFTARVKLDFIFEQTQYLRFIVIDVDGPSRNVEDHDLLGIYETTLSQIVSSKGGTIYQRVTHPKRGVTGSILVTATEVSKSTVRYKIQLAGRSLDKKDLFGKSDPFFVLSRWYPDNVIAVYRSEIVKSNLNPNWIPFQVSSGELCVPGGEESMTGELLLEVFDHDQGKEPEFIGSARLSVRQLFDRSGGEFPIMNEKRKKKPIAGYIRVIEATSFRLPTFLDFISGGTEISLKVAIDFTGSNGDPRSPKSLHYMSEQMNDYQKAILAVGSILEVYDSDKQFPVYGFGAAYRDNKVSHCFPLTGNYMQPYVFRTSGILDIYNAAIPYINLAGPTNFAPTIEQTIQQIQQEGDPYKYTFLLILTDGEISDLTATKDAIIRASEYGLSIVIIGIGNSDFQNMDELDSDEKKLSLYGKVAKRDIVQFVPFRKFVGKYNGERLASEVLAEIPNQVVEYFNSRNIRPKPPRPASIHSFTEETEVSNNAYIPDGKQGMLGQDLKQMAYSQQTSEGQASGSGSGAQLYVNPPPAYGDFSK
ncbi:Copine-8 [Nowakowskiella sp. JEL0407]|nr:Copine-8 [Nowakowskiella sp. JEL0407]